MLYHDHETHNLQAMTNAGLLLGANFDAVDYVQAQKVRSFAIRTFHQLFNTTFDLIATPTTACLPPRWHTPGSDMSNGISDAETLFKAMVFIFIGNLTGAPAITTVSGYAKNGLPTGIQIMGRHSAEEDVIMAAEAIERNVKRQKPKVLYENLR